MNEAEPSPQPGRPERPDPDRALGFENASEPARAREPHPQDPAIGDGPAPALGHPIVAGYDGSPPSRNALAYAAGMARRLGRPLLIVHVSPPSVYCEPLTGQVIGAVRESRETTRWLLAELNEVADASGLEVAVATRRGNPARELAAAAGETEADALVIGAPGQRWHHVAGSVPGWLARHARCPVIVVP